MTHLTLMPGGEAPAIQQLFTADCPNSFHVVVRGSELAIENYCGRFFEWLADTSDDELVELLGDYDWSACVDGFYVVEGHVVRHAEDGEHEWQLDRVRPLTNEEWGRYRSGAEIWPPEHFASSPTEPEDTSNEARELLDAGKGWLEWRRNIEIDLSGAEHRLVTALFALMDEGDHAATAVPDKDR